MKRKGDKGVAGGWSCVEGLQSPFAVRPGVDGGWQGRTVAKLCEECAISEQSTRWRRGFQEDGSRGYGEGGWRWRTRVPERERARGFPGMVCHDGGS